MFNNKLSTLALVAITISSQLVVAEDDSDKDDDEKIVVVSSRVPIPLREVATSVSIITEEDLIDRGYANLADALKVQPSIHVDNNGGIGSPTSLRIRGEEGFRTLVRIDGVDISDPTGTQVLPQLGQLMSSNIDRVEILRGPQGLVYGADAGGVINISSGYAEEGLNGQVSIETGRYSTDNLVADLGYADDGYDFYIAVSDYSTTGFNSLISDTSQDTDGYDNTTIHARLGVSLSDDIRFNLVARDTDGEGEYDNCFRSDFSSTNDCLSTVDQQNLRASLDIDTTSGVHQIAYIQTDISRDFLTEGASTFLSEGEVERFEYLGNTIISETQNLVYGIDWEEESITTSQQSRNQTGYYLEYQSEVSTNLFITAGLRFDDTDDVGNHTSYRTSAAYVIPTDVGEFKLRAAYGTGFRAPSLFEVNYNASPSAFPPASETQLTEEVSQGFEIGLGLTSNDGSSYEIIYFDQEVEDAIFFDLAGFSGYLQDEGTSFSEGVELIATIRLTDSLGVDANYTYNETEDTGGERRIRRPQNVANIGVFFQYENLRFSTYLRSFDGIIDGGRQLDGYELFDFSVRYQATTEIELFARIENVFNKEYQDIATFNTPGSSAYAGFRYQF